jgi:hypothetical protein
VSLTPLFPPLRPTSPLQVPILRHLIGQHRRSPRALSPFWLPYPPGSSSRIPAPSGYHSCATHGPDCATYRQRRPATPYIAGLTGCLRPAPSAAHVGEYHSTAPSSAPFRGQSGRGGACHTPENPHRMITRDKTGFRVVPDHLVLTAATSSLTPSPIPSFAYAALTDPHWCATMEEEYGALISNGTLKLVPRPQGSNVVTSK